MMPPSHNFNEEIQSFHNVEIRQGDRRDYSAGGGRKPPG